VFREMRSYSKAGERFETRQPTASRSRDQGATRDQQVHQGQRQHEFAADGREARSRIKAQLTSNVLRRNHWREERAKSASSTSILLTDTPICSRILSNTGDDLKSVF
jgi:hypothetical protein